MKKQIIEPDYLGGQGSLTKQEELALSKYFLAKKISKDKSASTSVKKKAKSKMPA